jgi:hypothetical protein
MTHGPDSAPRLISSSISKEGPLNLHIWVALSHFYDWNLKQIHKKYRNSTQQTNTQITKHFIWFTNEKKYTKIGILIKMGRLTNLIFNLQFQIPSLLQSVLRFSILDFALLRKELY